MLRCAAGGTSLTRIKESISILNFFPPNRTIQPGSIIFIPLESTNIMNNITAISESWRISGIIISKDTDAFYNLYGHTQQVHSMFVQSAIRSISTKSSESLHISGAIPENLFPCKCISFNLVNWPNSDGTLPLKSFPSR